VFCIWKSLLFNTDFHDYAILLKKQFKSFAYEIRLNISMAPLTATAAVKCVLGHALRKRMNLIHES
jgi:hypothetical protein